MIDTLYYLSDKEKRAERIETLKAKCAAFTLADFGGESTLMESIWKKPPVYPRAERPRIFLTGDMIPKIKAALENPEYKNLAQIFKASANTELYTSKPGKCKLSEEYLNGGPYEFDGSFLPLDITGTTYNWDGKILAIIEAKALTYLLTGEELYAREAIYFIKNAIRTLRFTKDLFIDPFRSYCYCMLVTAEVYDWCNAYLTDEDKKQLISGCQYYLCAWDPKNKIHNMEIGYPPRGGSGVSGHAISVMLMRDYMAMSAAIYEDRPDWWEYCAGRYFEHFVPPANYYFQGGLAPQGTGCYCHNKFHTHMSAAWVCKCATGLMPYDEGLSRVMESTLGHMLPSGYLFETGDAGRTGHGSGFMSVACNIFASGLFPDPAVSANAKYYSEDYKRLCYFINENSESMTLIMCANAAPPAPDRFSAIPLVCYNPFPYGQLIAHNHWGKDCAASFMKIGELTTANHDHQDSGTFQLFYKSLLATNSGNYSVYGNSHHYFYHQATIAQNGLLVFNPALQNRTADKGGSYEQRRDYWYSGSQKKHPEAATMEQWLSGDYVTGKVTGVAHDYVKGENMPTYAYISGDITPAYDDVTVDKVERRMLTAYTKQADAPMILFVYDKISAKDESFKKSFLLHTTGEPQIDGDTVSMVNGEGKLIMKSLAGAKRIEKIGGEGAAFMIDGENCTDYGYSGEVASEHTDRIWGRVEISTEGNKDDEFFNVLYVTDAKNDSVASITPYENDELRAASLLGACAVFVKDSERTDKALTFVGAEGTEHYYISGVAAGEWQIYANGKAVASAVATEEGGFLSFDAPAGEITVKKA